MYQPQDQHLTHTETCSSVILGTHSPTCGASPSPALPSPCVLFVSLLVCRNYSHSQLGHRNAQPK